MGGRKKEGYAGTEKKRVAQRFIDRRDTGSCISALDPYKMECHLSGT